MITVRFSAMLPAVELSVHQLPSFFYDLRAAYVWLRSKISTFSYEHGAFFLRAFKGFGSIPWASSSWWHLPSQAYFMIMGVGEWF
jgi:hypothetical protein